VLLAARGYVDDARLKVTSSITDFNKPNPSTRLCGVVKRVAGYRPSRPGLDSKR
jgi:hypothetical protein